ncbi:GtrA family protein [Massilia niabensis]|uniref:GtrA family protein n=1 Tax=Massilia niabensis TaxID=544910 RepID=A0ABW0L9B1_9BURK
MRRLTLPGPQFLVFVAGGALSALVDIGLLQLLVYNGVAPLAATSAGFLAGLCVNYAFHAKVTFKNVTTVRTLSRFLCVVGLNYLLTLGLVAVSVALVEQPLVGKLVSLPLVAMNGFFLSKHWIFK